MCARVSRQSTARRARNMTRLAALLLLLHYTCPAHLTPSFDHLYEKLDRLNSPNELYEKLEKFNALTPSGGELTDDDEELLQAMQLWGKMDSEEMQSVVRELQSVRGEDYGKGDGVIEGDDSDGDWGDGDPPEGDYPADFYADEDPDSASTSRPVVITPSDLIKPRFQETVVSAVDPIAATNERPAILDDSNLTARQRTALQRAAFANIAAVIKSAKCSRPQPRWFTVRHLAPSANIVYLPPCVQLHRCAPDSGCCYDENEVCAPVAGEHVEIPFYLQKADGSRSAKRMRFFNHTHCACVSRETLQTTVRSRAEVDHVTRRKSYESSEEARQRQNDWRASTEEPSVERDEEHTSPPQLRRCTCPKLFLAQPLKEGLCSCVCDWPDHRRKNGCLSLARGREHFGMSDRVCIDHGDCNSPTCEYGEYERTTGRCPPRQQYKRIRYHHSRRFIENTSD